MADNILYHNQRKLPCQGSEREKLRKTQKTQRQNKKRKNRGGTKKELRKHEKRTENAQKKQGKQKKEAGKHEKSLSANRQAFLYPEN